MKYYSGIWPDQKPGAKCRAVVEGEVTMSPDMLHKLADAPHPKDQPDHERGIPDHEETFKNYYQCLVMFRDNSSKLTAQRIYDLFWITAKS